MACALVVTTSGAASRKKYAAAPAPIEEASRIVSRRTAEAPLAVCARVRRVAGMFVLHARASNRLLSVRVRANLFGN